MTLGWIFYKSIHLALWRIFWGVLDQLFLDFPNMLPQINKVCWRKNCRLPQIFFNQNNSIEWNFQQYDFVTSAFFGWRGWKFNQPSHNYILSIFLFYFTIHVFRDLPKIAKSKRIVKLLWRNFLIFLPCIHLKKNLTATYQVERIFNAHVWNVLL